MVGTFALSIAFASPLAYRPAPALNPLKGLVPYAGAPYAAPHSMEFSYFPLSAVLKAKDRYDWTSLEEFLTAVSGRGRQAIFRFYAEYPKQESGLPPFLEAEGVRVERYRDEEGSPIATPDYRDPKLQSALVRFVEALGKRYDGDPRIAAITAGLLGYWGEWHTYPRTDLHPPKGLQKDVMDAYERAFRRTPILLRYPAREHPEYAPNHDRPRLGFHDDSFAWATLATGREEDSWFFGTLLQRSGTTDRWKTAPIGGEIRPEAWGSVFDPKPARPEIQNFRACVEATHVSWLMDSGLTPGQPAERMARAEREIQRMGYELTVARAEFADQKLTIRVDNRGVAPLYADWPVELGRVRKERLVRVWRPGWTLNGILPGAPALRSAPLPDPGRDGILLRVRNPLPNGIPLRFANVGQDQTRKGWLTLRAEQ
jgi:hypothetical protein